MKNKLSGISAAAATLVGYGVTVATAFAQTTGLAAGHNSADKVGTFMSGVLKFIDQVLLPVILGLAFLMFVWGVFRFFVLGGSDEEAQQKGKSLMLYAIAGFVLILSFYGIVSVLTNGLGFGGHTSLDNAGSIKTGFQVNGN